MKLVARIIIYLLFACIALAAIAIVCSWLALNTMLDDKPQVSQFESASLDDLRRIKALALDFSQQRDTSEPKRVVLSERDINLAIGHFLPLQVKLPDNAFVKVTLAQEDYATINATLPAAYVVEQAQTQYQQSMHPLLQPALAWLRKRADGEWLNLNWQLQAHSDQAHSDQAHSNNETTQWASTRSLGLGGINLNSAISNYIINTLYQQNVNRPEMQLALQSWQNLRGLDIADNRLAVEFMLPTQGAAALNSYQALVLSADEQALVEIYRQKLQTLPQRGPLVRVVAELFKFAYERSTQTADPIAENRAALLALSKRYGGDQLLNMLQSRQTNPLGGSPKPYTIYGRKDLAQHLVLSAGLSLIANQQLAELIGIDKEMSDLLRGRNISAWDLLADKAGVRLAENATHSARSARTIQSLLSKARRDRDLLPDLGAEFSFSEDRFNASDLADLELMIELYMEQHRALQKQL